MRRPDPRARPLEPADLGADPLRQIADWLADALAADLPEPTAMSLATADGRGRPSVRPVLLKLVDARGLVFHTNYDSRKGRELAGNPHAAVALHWAALARVVRAEGRVRRTSRADSASYFVTRPHRAQLAAWASRQSTVITDRAGLEAEVDRLEQRYAPGEVPLPPHWGGYRLTPTVVEFWHGRHDRLHDRIRYRRIRYPRARDGWVVERLSP